MPPAMQMRVEMVQLDVPRFGLWCDACLLPSRVEIDWLKVLFNAYTGVVAQAWTAVTEMCPQCGTHRWKETP